MRNVEEEAEQATLSVVFFSRLLLMSCSFCLSFHRRIVIPEGSSLDAIFQKIAFFLPFLAASNFDLTVSARQAAESTGYCSDQRWTNITMYLRHRTTSFKLSTPSPASLPLQIDFERNALHDKLLMPRPASRDKCGSVFQGAKFQWIAGVQ